MAKPEVDGQPVALDFSSGGAAAGFNRGYASSFRRIFESKAAAAGGADATGSAPLEPPADAVFELSGGVLLTVSAARGGSVVVAGERGVAVELLPKQWVRLKGAIAGIDEELERIVSR